MKKRFLYCLAAAVLALVAFSSAEERRPITVFMIGDSTMANKPTEQDNQERGWGQMLSGYFSDDVVVDNHAVNGRSSLSFINEGRWQAVTERIRPGDYVIIQFGHNDEKPKADRHTEPGSTFDANLKKFCDETRQRGGQPILMNCIVRRKFTEGAKDDDDQFGVGTEQDAPQGERLVETHILTREDGTKADYVSAPRHVAEKEKVPFVDMNRLTHDLIQGLGNEKSKELFCWIEEGTNLAAPKGRKDDTHLNVRGARLIAGLAADAIAEAVPALRPYVRHYDYVVAKDGSGDFFTVQEAVNAVPDYRKAKTTILIQPGTYKEKLVIAESKSNIRFVARGYREDGLPAFSAPSVITYDDWAQRKSPFGEELGTSGSSSVYVYAPGFEADGITFENTAGRVGQAVAILIKGDKAVFRRCRFLGNQDTVYTFGQQSGERSREYFEDCYIEGTVDFIFGWATAVFNRCELHALTNGYYTAASTPKGQAYGYVFKDCRLTAEPGVKSYLGRPWRDYAHVVFLDCTMDDCVRPERWHDWGKPHAHRTAFYAEGGCTGPGAVADAKAADWSHSLTPQEARRYDLRTVLAADDGWDPIGADGAPAQVPELILK